MNWTEQHIKKLKSRGQIKGYSCYSGCQQRSSTGQRTSKALVWLKLNIPYWCKERSLELKNEYRFDKTRKWRFDFCIPDQKIAIEYEGGIYLVRSGHNTAKHYTKDTDKYNAAAILGWRVIRVTAANYKTVLNQLKLLYGK